MAQEMRHRRKKGKAGPIGFFARAAGRAVDIGAKRELHPRQCRPIVKRRPDIIRSALSSSIAQPDSASGSELLVGIGLSGSPFRFACEAKDLFLKRAYPFALALV